MRIVAGRFKGRRLYAPKGASTRPTSDRVREALFSVLGDVEGARVLDLFAGTGALGIEALSRGASYARFVESDAAAIAAITRNADPLGLPYDVVKGDAIRMLASRALQAGSPFDLVFIDPPYSSAPRMGERLAELLPRILSEDGRIVTESDKHAPLALELPLEFERDYGNTRIRIHRV